MSVDSVGVTPSDVAISGSNVILTLVTAVTVEQSVTLTYTQPVSDALQDTGGLTVENFSDQVVTNTTAVFPPTVPQNLMAVSGSRQVTLTWEASASNGGSVITHYEYRYKTTGNYLPTWTSIPDGSDVDTDASNETTFIVTSLTNELYTFQVRAVNSVEVGASASVEVTPSDLAVPENFQVTVSPKVLTFNWDIDSAKTQPHHHVLMMSSDDGVNFERVTGAENIQGSPYSLSIATYKVDWSRSHYKLQACNEDESFCEESTYSST